MASNIEAVSTALESAVKRLTEGKDVAVAFSGGLDSGIVAAITGRYAKSVVLYTVGYGESYDVRMAREMSEKLGMDWIYIPIYEDDLVNSLKEMISITGTSSPLMLAFETPPFYVCKNCKEELIIGGQGSDELFAGYSKYVGLGKDELTDMMAEDMSKLTGPTLEHEKKVADHFGKRILYPFLDESVLSAVRGLGVEAIMPKDADSRKMLLKDVALYQGFPFISNKGKKAAQYGSGMMDAVHKICKEKGVRYSELVEQIRSEL